MGMAKSSAAWLVGLALVACNSKPAGPRPGVQVFADEHAVHMRQLATELAPRCPRALARLPGDGTPPLPDGTDKPTTIAFGSLIQEKSVDQVAVSCKRGDHGIVIASLHDPFAEGKEAIPQNGCKLHDLKSSGGVDQVVACVDAPGSSSDSIRMARAVDGGEIEVFVSFTLGRR